jgi:hypothetical protein
MIVYLSGGITGIPDAPARFAEAAASLRASGYHVISPIEICPDPESYEHAMRIDIAALTKCDRIAFLPQWEKSRGAQAEAHVARVCGIRPIYLTPREPFSIMTATHRATVMQRIDETESAVFASMTPLGPEHFAEQKRVDSEREQAIRPRRWWQWWRAA